MSQKVYVIGCGMTRFVKPGSVENFDYPDMAREAAEKALKDANVQYSQIEAAYAGYVYGDSTCGQRALYQIGMTGIPIVNVNNNCSTGSTALLLAKNAIAGGQVKCVMAIGFEKMQRGSLTSQFSDRANPMEKHVEVMSNLYDISAGPVTAQFFGNAGKDYLKKYNLPEDDDVFARIAYKNHKHSVNNPYSQFRKEYSLDEIKKSPMVHEPLTKLQCCPTSDGAACVILASEEFVNEHAELKAKAVEILALEMATDLQSTFSDDNCMKLVGFDMTALAAKRAFDKASIKPSDIQVVELHDCFSANELITYEALGLCEPGKAVELVKKGDCTYGGKYVINPSGGLISKGHPLGATGLAQCSELCWQLRGEAEKRQVANCKYALQHNVGLGGAVVVGIYKLGFTKQNTTSTPSKSTHKAVKFFQEIEDRLKTEGKALVSKINAIIGFDVKTASSQSFFYTIDLKNGTGSVTLNDQALKPEVTISISDDDLLSIMDGKLNMMSAFSQKKLKITGNMSIAMRLNQLFATKVKSKL